MTKKILLTRPRAASERWAALLARHGYDSVIEPLLTIEPTSAPRPAGNFQAVVLTSANAPDALDAMRESIQDLISLPCFCVGVSTGAVARAIGFTDIITGLSDGADLARKIAGTLTDTGRPLLHIAGDVVESKVRDILTGHGFTLAPWVVYRAYAADDFSLATREAFAAGNIAAVPVFSPRSARILVSLIEKNRLTQACSKMVAVGLSQAVADMLQTLPWRQLRVAAAPLEEDVLACLELAMTQNENSLPPPPAAARKKSGSVAWSLLAVIALVVAGAAAATYPWVHPFHPPIAEVAPGDAALERRIDALETRLNALTEIPPAPPQASADTTALTEQVKNLQAQVAQLQSKDVQNQQSAQKLVAASFAFWYLREAAHNGQSFAPQLAALRAAAMDDIALIEQIAALEPYANNATPTLPQLRDELATLEPTIGPTETTDAQPSLASRFKTIFRPLISLRPLHNPQLAGVEQALGSGDAQAALDASKNLPAETQTALTAWQAKLEARIAIDADLRAVAAHFTAPTGQGTAP